MKCCQIPLCSFLEAIMPYMSKALGKYSGHIHLQSAADQEIILKLTRELAQFVYNKRRWFFFVMNFLKISLCYLRKCFLRWRNCMNSCNNMISVSDYKKRYCSRITKENNGITSWYSFLEWKRPQILQFFYNNTVEG